MTDELPTLDPGRSDAPGTAPSLRIQHVHGSRDGTSLPIPAGTANLGRRKGMEVQFDHATDFLVSGCHARLAFKETSESWQVEDIGSTNGTFVNGERVKGTQRLRSGDVITLGASDHAEGAVAMQIDIEGEARPPDARSPGGDEDTNGERLFGRMKRGFQRYKDRREIRRRLDDDQRQIPSLEATEKRSCSALGWAMWEEGLVGGGRLPSQQQLDPFREQHEQLKSELAALEEDAENARGQLSDSEEAWLSAHAELESTSETRDAEAVASAEKRDAASAAVVQAFASRFDALKEARAGIVELLGQAGQPEPDLDQKMREMAQRLTEVADTCAAPIESVGDLFAARVKFDGEATAAATSAREARAAVDASATQRASEKQALEDKEQKARDARTSFEQDAQKLRDDFADAFSTLGAEAVQSPDPSIEALGSFAPARLAVTARAEVVHRIAEGKAALEQLRG